MYWPVLRCHQKSESWISGENQPIHRTAASANRMALCQPAVAGVGPGGVAGGRGRFFAITNYFPSTKSGAANHGCRRLSAGGWPHARILAEPRQPPEKIGRGS